jgi:23S rRNA (uridine2552-2'-O)-methyltransferase
MARKGRGRPGPRSAVERLSSARRRKGSSTRWLQRHINDPYVRAARAAGYRSRAAYKLIELDERFHLLRPGRTVVDLGAAPGGWSQVAAERVRTRRGKGRVIALDHVEIEPIAGVETLILDVQEMDLEAPTGLAVPTGLGAEIGGQVDVVLSDMAPPASGHSGADHLRIVALCEAALELAITLLRPGGAFVAKVYKGGAEPGLRERLKRHFQTVRHVKPAASRPQSAEIYVVATGFRGPAGG